MSVDQQPPSEDRRAEVALHRIERIEDQIESVEYIMGEGRKIMVGGITTAAGAAIVMVTLSIHEGDPALFLKLGPEGLVVLFIALAMSVALGVGGWLQQRHYEKRVRTLEGDLAQATGQAGQAVAARASQEELT